ncbi:hypothetical protein HED60_11875 [Planctomycetales bacterium ZRK34]|nr:hypothetical protein HED60_11875 [Planctomycetales bacterium ZRK34]
MRRKVLKDYANTVCQMFVGWRMGDDAQTLAQIGDGIVVIDLLAGTASLQNNTIQLWIAGELQAWLRKQLQASRVDISQIKFAVLEVTFTSVPVPQKHRRGTTFDWKCRSVIATDEVEYVGTLAETHTWAGVG